MSSQLIVRVRVLHDRLQYDFDFNLASASRPSLPYPTRSSKQPAYEAALVQMSGGVMERQTDPGAKLDFAKLQEKFFTGSLVSIYCKEKGNTFGLCPGCPYGILDMVEQQGFQLIRLRNPYGASGKWQGAIPFGKKTELRDKLGAHNKADDGTFWIHFKELVNLFDGGMISICRLFKQEYRIFCYCLE